MTTLRKGSFVRIKGTMRVDSYETADGSKRTSFEVVARMIEVIERSAEAVE